MSRAATQVSPGTSRIRPYVGPGGVIEAVKKLAEKRGLLTDSDQKYFQKLKSWEKQCRDKALAGNVFGKDTDAAIHNDFFRYADIVERALRIRLSPFDRECIERTSGCPIDRARVHFLGDNHTDVGMQRNRTRYLNQFARTGDIVLLEGSPNSIELAKLDLDQDTYQKVYFYSWDHYGTLLQQVQILKLQVAHMDLVERYMKLLDQAVANDDFVIPRILDKKMDQLYEFIDYVHPLNERYKELRNASLLATTSTFLQLFPDQRVFVMAGRNHIKAIEARAGQMGDSCVVYFKDTDEKSFSPSAYTRHLAGQFQLPFPIPDSSPSFQVESSSSPSFRVESSSSPSFQVESRALIKIADLLCKVYSAFLTGETPLADSRPSLCEPDPSTYSGPISLRKPQSALFRSSTSVLRESLEYIDEARRAICVGDANGLRTAMENLRENHPSLQIGDFPTIEQLDTLSSSLK